MYEKLHVSYVVLELFKLIGMHAMLCNYAC